MESHSTMPMESQSTMPMQSQHTMPMQSQPAMNDEAPRQDSDHSDMTMAEKVSHGNALDANDIDNPQNWPVTRKIYVSLVASGFTFALLFAATSYSLGIGAVAKDLGISAEKAIVPYALFFFGIAFAPLFTPHWSERTGRNVVYQVSAFLMAIFLIGSGRSKSFASLAATRFFAGLFGGPIVVNIEGTFADVWPATFTGTYYAFIALAQYLGASTGAVLGGTLVVAQGWRYTQYVSIILITAALLFGFGAPDSYPRQIQRNISRARGVPANLEPALSGSTFKQAAYLTLVQPLMMLVREPIVMGIALYLSLNFGVLFQFFVSVPNVLNMLAKFTPKESGLAFLSGIGGSVVAALTIIALDQIGARMNRGKMSHGVASIEYRMWPAIVGSLFLWISLFWIGFTANPSHKLAVPVVGTAFYVWGSMMQLAAFVGYLFDAYPPQAILSSLTVCAVARVLTAGWVPLVISFDLKGLGGKWAFGTFGVIGAVLFAIVPFGIMFFGAKLRARSGYSRKYHDMSPMMMEQHETMEQEQ